MNIGPQDESDAKVVGNRLQLTFRERRGIFSSGKLSLNFTGVQHCNLVSFGLPWNSATETRDLWQSMA